MHFTLGTGKLRLREAAHDFCNVKQLLSDWLGARSRSSDSNPRPVLLYHAIALMCWRLQPVTQLNVTCTISESNDSSGAKDVHHFLKEQIISPSSHQFSQTLFFESSKFWKVLPSINQNLFSP